MYQYSGNGAAEDCSAVNGTQDDKAGVGRHGKGQRQHQRHAHGRRKTRQTADDYTQSHAAYHGQQVKDREGAYKALTHKL